MYTLKPFAPSSVSVLGSFVVAKGSVHLKFLLGGPAREVEDSLVPGQWSAWPRADELWKTTCFEAFWGIPGEAGYWELNLSPAKKSWNIYRFDGYREPQPPRASEDFALSSVKMDEDSLECELKTPLHFARLEISLTAVIRTATGVSYFALKHAANKPDFHDRASFIATSS